MSSCELCGRNPSVYDCVIEGTKMKVCQECSRFGSVKGKSNVKVIVQEAKRPVPKEPEYVFVKGYGMIIKNAREKLGLKQEDFAKNINEHKSLIHQVESEHIKPSTDFARKLERALRIKIVEEVKSDELSETGTPTRSSSKSSSQGFTFGDMITTKKK
ncbi:MAG: helix-turn-helix domain-containing protein [Candidatus Woesearchaeota archaeon]